MKKVLYYLFIPVAVVIAIVFSLHIGNSVDKYSAPEPVSGYEWYKQRHPMVTEQDYNRFLELKASGKPFYTDKDGFPHLPGE